MIRGQGGKKRKQRASSYASDHRTIPARAKQAGLSVRAFYVQIAKGIGPKITFVSTRRRIVTDPDFEAWMIERRDNPPAAVTKATSPNPRAATFKQHQSVEAL
jgi:hypothetical protein